MKLIQLKIALLLFHTSFFALGNETCSRTAIVNYQEILVDPTSSDQGEGLRYYLNKDPVAEKYLDEYQKNRTPKWLPATIGTIGTTAILTGLFTPKEEKKDSNLRDTLIIGGVSVLLLNFLITKTLDYSNNHYLDKAVREYNKRNLPRIYFSPFKKRSEINRNPSSLGLGISVYQEF